MTQFGGRNKTTGVLVKVSQTFDEVVGGVARASLRNGLVDRQKDLERNTIVGLQLLRTLLDVRFGWVLAERSQAFADLMGVRREIGKA